MYFSCLFPRLLRPIAATVFYFPALMVYKYMSYLLRPTIEQAMREQNSLANGSSKVEKKLTLVHMLMDRYKQGEFQYDQLVKDVITATFESTPTTAVSLYWMLTELLQRPDLVEELREEVTGVLHDGKLPATPLTELPKLDSFMRESARVNIFHYRELISHTTFRPAGRIFSQDSSGPQPDTQGRYSILDWTQTTQRHNRLRGSTPHPHFGGSVPRPGSIRFKAVSSHETEAWP